MNFNVSFTNKLCSGIFFMFIFNFSLVFATNNTVEKFECSKTFVSNTLMDTMDVKKESFGRIVSRPFVELFKAPPPKQVDDGSDTIAKFWTLGGAGAINFTQGHVSDNWSLGGQSSLTFMTDFNLFANYKKGNSSWQNNLAYKYGLLKTDDLGEFKKNEDRLELNFQYGQRAFVSHWNYGSMLNVRTQIFEGKDYSTDPSTLISDFLSPGYVLLSIGMEYKPTDKFSLMLSPLTSKTTLVLNEDIPSETFGLEPGTTSKSELGAFLKSTFRLDFTDNVYLQNSFDIFTNYEAKFGEFDINWEMTLFMKINKYIAATVNTYLIYDSNVSTKVQFREIIGVGFSYKF